MFEFLITAFLAVAAVPFLLIAGVIGCALWAAWTVFKVAWGVAWAVVGLVLCGLLMGALAVGCGLAWLIF